MGVRLLHDEGANYVALYDSVTETAFGPLFGYAEDGTHPLHIAEEFLKMLNEHDARTLSAKTLREAHMLLYTQHEMRTQDDGCQCPGSLRELGIHSVACSQRSRE